MDESTTMRFIGKLLTALACSACSATTASAACSGDDCGNVEITNVILQTYSEQGTEPETGPKVTIDGKEVADMESDPGYLRTDWEADPHMAIPRGKPFYLDVRPADDWVEALGDNYIFIKIGCGVSEVEVDGVVFKVAPENSHPDVGYTKTHDYGNGSVVSFSSTGCGLNLTFHYSRYLEEENETSPSLGRGLQMDH
ncbi:hypothetical protein [Luteolibacter sp. Populi]|uniref:hypothetical protein n=1 Tax=Luteolibacter sp. Populi TaxID=3230487 RepID=UPI0034679FD0